MIFMSILKRKIQLSGCEKMDDDMQMLVYKIILSSLIKNNIGVTKNI